MCLVPPASWHSSSPVAAMSCTRLQGAAPGPGPPAGQGMRLPVRGSRVKKSCAHAAYHARHVALQTAGLTPSPTCRPTGQTHLASLWTAGMNASAVTCTKLCACLIITGHHSYRCVSSTVCTSPVGHNSGRASVLWHPHISLTALDPPR